MPQNFTPIDLKKFELKDNSDHGGKILLGLIILLTIIVLTLIGYILIVRAS